MLIPLDELQRFVIDLVDRRVDVVIHGPLQEYFPHAALIVGDNGRPLSAAQHAVKQGVDSDNRLAVGLDSVHLGQSSGVHGPKAHRCHRRHDGAQG